MIAALCDNDGGSKDGASFARLVESGAYPLGRWVGVAGHLLVQTETGELRDPMQRANRAWAPGRTPSGRLALFNGQLHNRAALWTQLGAQTGRNGDAELYALALDRWGDTADEHVIGHYCAIVLDPDHTSLRLSRSPLTAPPLHFRHDGARAIAASIPRPLFWQSGTTRRVNLDRLARSALIDFTDRFAGWYEGCGRMPLGCAVRLTPRDFAQVWRYDLFTRPRQRLPRDQDYVDAANALLDEGVAAVLADSRQPGVLLSGGLDSSQVALSALRRMPVAQDLPAFTYGPQPQWNRPAPPGRYASEFAAVAQLAAANSRLKPEYFTHDGQDFRHGMRELLQAMDCGAPALGLAWMYHDLCRRARARGCDVLLTGDWGNMTFSSSAPWGPVEFFRRGRWPQLWQLLRHEPADTRSMARRFLARVIMPQLPRGLWQRVHGWRYGAPPDGLRRSGLSPQWAGQHRLIEQARNAGWDAERLHFTSQRQFWQRLMIEDGQDHEQVFQGLQQLHGVTLCDPTAYRPLVEFCYGVPTAQFTRGPMNRFLARRMAAGHLPDELRLNRELGQHHGDWPLRIDQARDELLAELDRMTGDSDISAMFDLPGLRRSLEDFSAGGNEDAILYQCALPTVIAAGRFIAYAKGRNDI